jgi:hypothetical protein
MCSVFPQLHLKQQSNKGIYYGSIDSYAANNYAETRPKYCTGTYDHAAIRQRCKDCLK